MGNLQKSHQVMVTNKVGASDLLTMGQCGFIVCDDQMTYDTILTLIKERKKLREINDCIMNFDWETITKELNSRRWEIYNK